MSESRKVAVDRQPDVARSPDSTGPATPSTGPDTDRTGAYVPAADPGTELPTVPGYEVLGILGQGGMGVVYRARQRSLKRVVALKMIRAADAPTADALARFQAEAEAAARVQHANIVQIHEVGNRDGLPYFSLEFCAGGNLESRLKGTRLSPSEAVALLEALARAVQHAHDHGVVHRDLKPANVLLAGEPDAPLPTSVPKIADFGLAKTLDTDSGQTRSGAVVGTPNYMAPEQAEGNNRSVGPAADIWALGAILYRCLTGRLPFQGGTVPQTLLLVRDADPVPPRRVQREIPRDLETICLKCLEKDPKRRYASAGELADDLRRFREYQPILARPVGFVGKSARWVRRRPAVLLGALLLLALTGGGAVGYHYWDRAQENARKKDESDRKAQESDRLAAEAQAVTVEHFTDIVNRRGMPEGVGPITEAEARVTEAAFRIHKRGGRVERVETLNDLSWGRLDNGYSNSFGLREDSPRVVATRYSYDEQGRLVREEGVDAWDYVHWVHTQLSSEDANFEARLPGRNPTIRLRCEWSAAGFPREVRTIDEQGRPVAGPSGVARIRLATNDAGQLESIETQDLEGRPFAPRNTPVALQRYAYDSRNRLAERTLWGTDGKPVTLNGVHRATYDYSPGTVEERHYDETGAPTNKIFQPHRFTRTYKTGEGNEAAFRADGSPGILPLYQAHSVTIRYTDRGVVTESVVRDPRGKPVNVNGFARQTYPLNESGLPIEQQQWMATPDGRFLLVSRQNGFGRALEERAYTPEGLPSVKRPHGVYRVVYEYDSRGNNSEVSGFDAEGRPAPLASTGTPRVRKRFNESNSEIERLHLDAGGRPTPGTGGWAKFTRDNDDTGKWKEDTAWVVDPEGKFRIGERKNWQNLLLEQAFHDPLGRPILGPQDYHRVKYERNPKGFPTDTQYFGVDNSPCNGPRGTPHRFTTRYNSHGQIAERAYFGIDGKPAVEPKGGTHCGVYTYNHLGQQTGLDFFGPDGKPMNGKVEQRATNGKTETLVFARREDDFSLLGTLRETRFYRGTPPGDYRLWRRLDPSQYIVEECFLDNVGNPEVSPLHGVHRITVVYGKGNDILDKAGFGTDGRPAVLKEYGAHRVKAEYDAAGRSTEYRFLGTDGKPCNGKDGAALLTRRYEGEKKVETASFKAVPGGDLVLWKRVNGAGKNLEEVTFDERGVPSIDVKSGVHRTTAKYDERDHLLESASFGLKGEPVVDKLTGVHRLSFKNDPRGNIIEVAGFDADQKPSNFPALGAHRQTTKYDAADRKVERLVFGTDGKPAVGKAGYHRRTWEYDDKGKLLREMSFDADGKPVGK